MRSQPTQGTTQQTVLDRQPVQDRQVIEQQTPPQDRQQAEPIKGRKTSIVPKGKLAIYLDWIESMGMDRAKGLEYVANLGLDNMKMDILKNGGVQ